MRIEDEYVKTGYFWLPERDEKKIPGVLTIKNGGDIELEVVGLFDDSIKSLNDDDDLNRIIGHVEKDGLVTLENCFYTQKNYAFGGISKSKLCVNRVLSGVAYDENESVTFNTLSFSVDCLDEWVGISGISTDSDWENKTATINYILPENISYELNNGMKLEICFSCTTPGSSRATEAKITQRVYFKLISEDLRPLCCNPPEKSQQLFIENSIKINLRSFLCVNQNSLIARYWRSSNKMKMVCPFQSSVESMA